MRAWITYEIITEESSAVGDAAERGYAAPYGWMFPCPEEYYGQKAKDFSDNNALTFHDVMAWAMDFAPWHGSDGTYYLEGSSDDWEKTKDGKEGAISYAIHFDPMSEGTKQRVERLLNIKPYLNIRPY